VAVVDESACNACTRCVADCPFSAITMAPRMPGGREVLVAEVDPARCVGCGICSGSCEPSAIGLPWLDQQAERRRIDAWLARDPAAPIVLGCEGSAAGTLHPDPATGLAPGLPGARVMLAPCAGWFSPFTVERALRKGTGTVVVVGCPEPTCRYREGDDLLAQRIAGTREPALRRDKVELHRLRVVALARHQVRELGAAVGGAVPAAAARRGRLRAAAAGVALAAVLGAGVVAVGAARHVPPQPGTAQLVVSFSHRGSEFEQCRDRTPEELAALPPHMRAPRVCTRGRAPVRLRVTVDGSEIHASTHEAVGAWGDGPSLAFVTIDAPEGEHVVEVAIGDTADAGEWSHVESRSVELSKELRRTVLFDRARGFTWE
jgi:Pyruvate/2-oxoacid:ferredoxin oxidoreductase delta subunit